MEKKFNLYKFFDYLGVVVFPFIFLTALRRFNLGDHSWDIYAYMLIGFGGFLVDGFLVFFYKEEE